MKKVISITLLVFLGLQFNAPALLWVGYSTFAHEYFASRCENPKIQSCQGHCQVEKAEKKATQSEHETLPSLTFAKIQPGAISVLYEPIVVSHPQQYISIDAPSLLHAVRPELIDPPRTV